MSISHSRPKKCKACGFESSHEDAHIYFARYKGCGRLQQHCANEDCCIKYHKMMYAKYKKGLNAEPILNVICARFKLWQIKGGDFE